MTISIIGVPYDAASSFKRGPSEAPDEIRKAFLTTASNRWTETGFDLSLEGVYKDAGNLDISGEDLPFSEIAEAVRKEVVEAGNIPIFLGGDHSITYPIIQVFSGFYSDLTVLDFDAHPDLYDTLDGMKYSHASPFARLMEENRIKRLVQVGIRTVNGHQKAQAERFGVEMIEMKDFHDGFIETLSPPMYISFDMDALDPAFAPGVSHPEPGGLSTRQVLDILHKTKTRIIGADIVELNPRTDIGKISAVTAAKLFKEIMGVIIRNG